MIIRKSLAVGGFLLMTSLFARDAVWTDTTDETATWNDAQNWQDGSGNPLGGYPNGADYDVSLGVHEKNYIQRIFMGGSTATSADYALGSLLGYDRYILLLQVKARKGQYAVNPEPFHLSIGNPNGYRGHIRAVESHAWLDMSTTDSFVPHYANVNVDQMMFANVTNAGTRGEIGHLYGPGVLVKTGAGTLAVKSASGVGIQIRLDQGSLELGDGDGDSAEALLANAWLHLDASRADTLAKTMAADGRLWVTNWSDVRGNGLSAKAPTEIGFGAPFLSGVKSETGLDLIDFGDIATLAAVDAPTNRCLELSENLLDGREFFYAGQYVRRNYNSAFGWKTWEYFPFHLHATCLYSVDNAENAVSFGDLAFDGVMRRVDFVPTADMWSKMHVHSIGANAGVRCNALVTDRKMSNRTGGMRLGEVVIFKTPLTHRQRQVVNRYLMRKWCAEYADCDVGTVTLAPGANEICVPDRGEAHIRRLCTQGQTLIKTGGGALRVDVIEPADASVSVQGGTVAFSGGLPAVDETQPATNPYLWLDATADSFTVSNLTGNATNYVAAWRDRRPEQTAVYARAPVASDGKNAFSGRLPFIRENAVGDLRAVNFGTGANNGLTDGNSAWLKLSVAGNENAYAGFIAFRMTNINKDQPVFGTTMGTANFARDYRTPLLHPKYALGVQYAARWSLNGKVIDPAKYSTDANGSVVGAYRSTNDFFVAAVSSDGLLRIDALGKERTDGPTCGNIEIGEFILYDRRLSDDEMRATEAYLMKKWMKKDHPDKSCRATGPKLTFPVDAPAVFDTDGTADGTGYAGGNGKIVKRGGGCVTVGEVGAGKVDEIVVDDGSLVVAFADESQSLLTPAWRFDASEKSRMQFIDGTSSVSNWFSSAGCTYDMHAVASPLVPDSKIPLRMPAYPTLVENAEFRPGVTGNYIDFGSFNSAAPAPEGSTASGFSIDDLAHNGKNICYNECWRLREAYAIVADREGETPQMTIFGSASRNDYRYDFLRGNNGSLFSTSARAGVRNGYIAIDGEEAEASTALPEGFHLVSVQPAADDTEFAENFRIDALAMDRGERGGGGRIAELVAYKGQHTPRQRTFIEQSLMHKWFGTSAPVWSHELTSLSVAEGSTLTVTGRDLLLSTPLLAGAGTIVADRISNVSELVIPGNASGLGTLTVDGAVRFADTVSVTVDADEPVGHGGAPYTILTATSLENVDLANWTVDVSFQGNRRAKLAKDGNAILIDIEKPGLIFIVH